MTMLSERQVVEIYCKHGCNCFMCVAGLLSALMKITGMPWKELRAYAVECEPDLDNDLAKEIVV